MKEKRHPVTPATVAALHKGDLENFLVASTPGGIERQEAMGQAAFVGIRDSLPLRGSEENRSALEAIGFKFGDPLDDLFVAVQLPKGWSKRPTDHSMWSELLDEQGRIRAVIFYKAAFYDRSAHMQMRSRYRTDALYSKDPEDYSSRYRVADCDGTILFDAGDPSKLEQKDRFTDPGREACTSWLNENFPDWQNPFAYW